jgi:hypothetical protein
MTSDLQADLDALADELGRLATLSWRERDDLADRLRHLLDDRGIDQAPLTSEIVAWLEADPDAFVECWISYEGEWSASWLSIAHWRARLAAHDDQRQPGYRLGVRQPATERVRLDQIIGRTLPKEPYAIVDIRWHGDRAYLRWEWFDSDKWHPLDVAADGTVEVLKVNPT